MAGACSREGRRSNALGDERVLGRKRAPEVATTNVDLQAAVKAGRFRSDCSHRLNMYPVTIPPLRDRLTDIPPMVEAMLQRRPARQSASPASPTSAMCALGRTPGRATSAKREHHRAGIILTPERLDRSRAPLRRTPRRRRHPAGQYPGCRRRPSNAEVALGKLCNRVIESSQAWTPRGGPLIQHAVQVRRQPVGRGALRITRSQLTTASRNRTTPLDQFRRHGESAKVLLQRNNASRNFIFDLRSIIQRVGMLFFSGEISMRR